MKPGITKQELISSLEFTLKLTREKVVHLELKDDETVIIHFEGGGSKEVNIACDSGLAIIKDICSGISF
jgi:hypothetical protein